MRIPLSFGLRWLFVGLIVVAVPLAWYANRNRQLAARRSAVDRIEKLGGDISLSGDPLPGQRLPGEQWGTWLFGDPTAFVSVHKILFDTRSAVHDDDLELLARFPDLRVLRLEGSQLSDRSLVHLGHVPQLENLYLGHMTLTEQSLAPISRLQQLRRLEIDPFTPSEIQVEIRRAVGKDCESNTLSP